MSVCVCVWPTCMMHVYVCMCIHACMCICIYICVCVCMCMHACVHINTIRINFVAFHYSVIE